MIPTLKENNKMPADVEKCVRDIKGKNKRTGKPYTQSEKWAICTAMHNKKKNASLDDDIVFDQDIIDEVEAATSECVRKMMDSGKAKTREDAVSMCEAMMAKSNFDPKQLWFVFNKELEK